jgi:hypothetical protein
LDNLEKIKSALPTLQEIKDLLSWCEGQRDLSEIEIEKTWQEFIADKPDIEINIKGHRMAIFKAHSRGLGWVVNYAHEPPNVDDEISDELLEKVMKRLKNW